MIPLVSLPTKDRKHLAKSITRKTISQILKSLNDRLISTQIRLIVIDRPAQFKGTAASPEAQAMLCSDKIYQFPFLRRL
jgi:hypothetical protein